MGRRGEDLPPLFGFLTTTCNWPNWVMGHPFFLECEPKLLVFLHVYSFRTFPIKNKLIWFYKANKYITLLKKCNACMKCFWWKKLFYIIIFTQIHKIDHILRIRVEVLCTTAKQANILHSHIYFFLHMTMIWRWSFRNPYVIAPKNLELFSSHKIFENKYVQKPNC